MSDYWERRKAQQMFEYMAGAEERADSISRLYLQASQYFSGQMDKIFQRYRKQNGLSESDARRLLNQIKTPSDIDELKQLLQQATETRTAKSANSSLRSWKLRHTGQDWNDCRACMTIWIRSCRTFISRSRLSTKHGI